VQDEISKSGHRIYAGACCLTVWLGEEEDKSNKALEIIDTFYEMRSHSEVSFEDWIQAFNDGDEHATEATIIAILHLYSKA